MNERLWIGFVLAIGYTLSIGTSQIQVKAKEVCQQTLASVSTKTSTDRTIGMKRSSRVWSGLNMLTEDHDVRFGIRDSCRKSYVSYR